ncbi:hypothetical protein RDABS01_021780 [Bienertia sinuspersici]
MSYSMILRKQNKRTIA